MSKYIFLTYIVFYSNYFYSGECIRNFQKTVTPEYVLETTSKSTNECKQHFDFLFKSIKKLDSWALQMVDASSKLPTGILAGNIKDFGNYDECLRIDEQTSVGLIRGKHCIASLDPENLLTGIEEIFLVWIEISGMPMMWSLCVPDTCSAADLNSMVSDFSLILGFDIPLHFNDTNCHSKATSSLLNAGAIIVISFFVVIITLAILSTLYDIILHYTKKKPFHIALIAFSILSNGRKLFTLNSSNSQILCLHGLRTISMMWIILGHIYEYRYPNTSVNGADVLQFMLSSDSMFVLAAAVAVDSFFLIGGVVLAYVFLNTMDTGQAFNLPLYYFHRYIRLTPALAAVILVDVALLPYLASGPLSNVLVIPDLIENCQNWWWSTLLYVQNYVNPERQCVIVSWYLAVDTQLFILSPLVLLPLRKWPKRTVWALVSLCFAVSVGVFLTAWHFKLVAVGVGGTPEQKEAMYKYYYVQTHTRALPWLVGIIVGYYIYSFKKSKEYLQVNNILSVILWILSLFVMVTCAFCGHNLVTDKYNRWLHAIYVTCVKPAWCLALGWVIFACVFDYGGPINWFLSLPIFQFTSKFTYSMYLVHFTIICLISASTKAPAYFSPFRMLFDFWGFFWLTFAVAIVWCLLFESPIIIFEKMLFSRKVSADKGKIERFEVKIHDSKNVKSDV